MRVEQSNSEFSTEDKVKDLTRKELKDKAKNANLDVSDLRKEKKDGLDRLGTSTKQFNDIAEAIYKNWENNKENENLNINQKKENYNKYIGTSQYISDRDAIIDQIVGQNIDTKKMFTLKQLLDRSKYSLNSLEEEILTKREAQEGKKSEEIIKKDAGKDVFLQEKNNEEKVQETDQKLKDSLKYKNNDYFNSEEISRLPKRERQALRWLLKKEDSKLFNIVKKINLTNTFAIMDKISNSEDITKESLEKYGYISKNGGKIEDRELRAIKELLAYKTKKENDQNFKALFDNLKNMALSGQDFTKIYAAKEVFSHINEKPQDDNKKVQKEAEDKLTGKEKKVDFSKFLEGMFGDLNFDGKVINATDSMNRQDWKNVDKGVLMGGQISEMYQNAKKINGEEKTIENIVGVIKKLNGYSNENAKNVNNEQGLLDFFKKNPAIFLAFRQKLMEDPTRGAAIFREGKTYADKEIQRMKAEEKLQKSLEQTASDFLSENPEMNAEIENRIQFAIDKQIGKQRQRLLILQQNLEFEAAKKLDSVKKEKVETAREKLQNLLAKLDDPSAMGTDSPAMQKMMRDIKLAGIGAAIASIKMPNGERFNAVGAGAALQSNTINEAIAKSKVFDSLTAGGGVMMDKNQDLSVGLSLSLDGGKQITNTTRVFYSAGAGRSPMGGGVQPALSLGIEQAVNNEKLTNTEKVTDLDAHSAKYLGAVATAGFESFAAQLYGRRDKLEGVEKKASILAEKMQPIFEKIFQNGTDTEAIAARLQDGFSNAKGETTMRGDQVYKLAAALSNKLSSYTIDKNNDSEGMLIGKLTQDFANQFAQQWRNEKIEEIIDEGRHLSQIGVGGSLFKAFAGFLGLGSLGFTTYTESIYKENAEAKKAALDGMNTVSNFDTLETTGGLQEKLNKLNELLNEGDKDIKYFKLVSGDSNGEYITLDKKIFLTTQVNIANDIKAHLVTDKNSDVIKIPVAADISLGTILGQKGETKFLAIGSKSFRGTEQITQDTILTGGLDGYKTYTDSVQKKVPVEIDIRIDGQPNSNLLIYLEKEGADELTDFRLYNKEGDYSRFMTLLNSGERDKSTFNSAVELLPDGIKQNVHTIDDLRFVYASLSRVSQTRDKQLSGTEAYDKAHEYLLKVSDLNGKISNFIDKVFPQNGALGDSLTDAEWKKLKTILKIPNNRWYGNASNTAPEKLFNLLTPPWKLVEARTESYRKRLHKEYSKYNNTADVVQYIMGKRTRMIESMKTAKLTSARGDIFNGLGAVAGYGTDEIDDKFVSGPKVIWNSIIDFNDAPDKIAYTIKNNFISELKDQDNTQYQDIKQKVETKFNKSYDDDSEFIKEMSDGTIPFSMFASLFADCINENIMMGKIEATKMITKTERVHVRPENKIYNYEAVITNDAMTSAKSLGVAVVTGTLKDKNTTKGETEPVVPEEEVTQGETIPVNNLDELKGDNIKTVDGNNVNITIDGKTNKYSITDSVTMPDGGTATIAYKFDEVTQKGSYYQVFKQGDNVVLGSLDIKSGKILGYIGIQPVEQMEPIVVSLVTIGKDPKEWYTIVKNNSDVLMQGRKR